MSLQENTIVLDVQFHKPTRYRKGSLNDVDIDADKDKLKLTKDIIQSDHYIECQGIQNKLDAFIKTRRLKGPFRRGVYLLPLGVLDEVYEALEKARDEYNAAANALAADWEEIVERAAKTLKSQFDAKSMPSVQTIRSAFGMEWSLANFSVPNPTTIGDALFAKEQKKAEASWKAAEQEVVLALRQSFRDLVSHLAEQLGDRADGSKRKLKQAAVDKVTDFLDSFANRNVLDDDELKTLVGRARKVINGRDASDLRDMREDVEKSLKKVAKRCDKLVTTQKRVIELDD